MVSVSVPKPSSMPPPPLGRGVAGDSAVGQCHHARVAVDARHRTHYCPDSAVDQRHHASVGVDGAAVGGAIAGNGTVGQRQRACVLDTTAETEPGRAVAGDGAVGQRQRACVADAAATAIGRAIAGDGAVDQRQRARDVDATSIVARAILDGRAR